MASTLDLPKHALCLDTNKDTKVSINPHCRKRIDTDSDDDEDEDRVAGFQEYYVVPVLGRRVTYDDMRYVERFILDTVDVLKTWNSIMEKRKQQEQQQAQHLDL